MGLAEELDADLMAPVLVLRLLVTTTVAVKFVELDPALVPDDALGSGLSLLETGPALDLTLRELVVPNLLLASRAGLHLVVLTHRLFRNFELINRNV